jgi:hypothetical protein
VSEVIGSVTLYDSAGVLVASASWTGEHRTILAVRRRCELGSLVWMDLSGETLCSTTRFDNQYAEEGQEVWAQWTEGPS